MKVSRGRQIFNSVRNNDPRRSLFVLDYDKKFDCDFGELIPVMCDEVVPGDVLSISNELVVRFQPLVAPILHSIDAFVHYFFVPYRLLWDEWEDFITGGITGELTPTLPSWDLTVGRVGKYSLFDYLGFPVGVIPTDVAVLDFPHRAYNFIFQSYYADETLLDEDDDWWITGPHIIQYRSWSKDYFTSALPFQQRGTAPAMPLAGNLPAVYDPANFDGTLTLKDLQWGIDATGTNGGISKSGLSTPEAGKLAQALSRNSVDLSSATTFDVSDLRLAFQIQRWLELNARAGARYTEFLRAHFGVSPRDDRLDRPEYIGGTRSPVIISEVLQTSSDVTGSPQGNLAGHGLVADRNFAGKYHVQEYGLVMGILSIMPKPAYQQGINRQWIRETKYDFYFPEFANLSEQEIKDVEIFAQSGTGNTGIFGYQGRYDEMRVKQDMVCGGMRDTLDYWHLARQFSTRPVLDFEFVSCNPANDDLKRVFAVPAEKGLIVNFSNKIRALRPMPYIAEPGLIDHV